MTSTRTPRAGRPRRQIAPVAPPQATPQAPQTPATPFSADTWGVALAQASAGAQAPLTASEIALYRAIPAPGTTARAQAAERLLAAYAGAGDVRLRPGGRAGRGHRGPRALF